VNQEHLMKKVHALKRPLPSSTHGARRSRLSAMLLTGTTFLLCASAAYGNTGSVTISHWRASYNPPPQVDAVSTVVWVSNTSASDVQVTIRLRDYSGAWLGDPAFVPSIAAGGFSSCNALHSSCTLQAGKTGYFNIAGPAATAFAYWGYGKIEWTASGPQVEQVSLLVDGMISYQSASGYSRVPVRFVAAPF
jgi:hypothetical protein